MPTTVRSGNLWTTRRHPRTAVALGALRGKLEALAPLHLAESWDNVGLLSGDDTKLIARVLLAVDVTPAVADEAVRTGADLLVSYHPPIFSPLKALRTSDRQAPALAVDLATRGIWVYAPHTALDTAAGGTNDVLAAAVGATVSGSFVHQPGRGSTLKLVVFVPADAVERVADAVYDAGAGNIGAKARYTQCSYRTAGMGTFLGDDSTNPAIGRRGRLERVPEVRFETVLPAARAGAVAQALLRAHPYEEPAFDLLPMVAPPEAVGLGRYAELAQPTTLAAFAEQCKHALGLPAAQVVGDPRRRISRLGIVAGSAGTLGLDSADPARYDCMLTGELKHHHMLAYAAAGLCAVCLGHGNTERPVLNHLARELRQAFRTLKVSQARADRDPFTTV